jgi:ABC-type uncharacterized transport system substrate-binding protein
VFQFTALVVEWAMNAAQDGLAAATVRRRGIARRRALCALAACAWPATPHAQQNPRIARIGWLTAQRAASLESSIGAFRGGLAALGLVEGRNAALEFRFGDDDPTRVPALAADLVRQQVDVIVAQGLAVTMVSKLGLGVPVVYVFSGDPVSARLAESLAKPRFNMSGISLMAAELTGKRLELLREFIPTLRHVAMIGNPDHPGEHLELAYSRDTAQRLGIRLDYHATRNDGELNAALAAMAREPPQAISLLADGFAIQNRQRIIEFGMRHRAPVISGWPIFVQSGALCTYGPDLDEVYRGLARYVDRVLKGARPADLPIEQPTKFQLLLNAKTARALGLAIPPALQLRADGVIG